MFRTFFQADNIHKNHKNTLRTLLKRQSNADLTNLGKIKHNCCRQISLVLWDLLFGALNVYNCLKSHGISCYWTRFVFANFIFDTCVRSSKNNFEILYCSKTIIFGSTSKPYPSRTGCWWGFHSNETHRRLCYISHSEG